MKTLVLVTGGAGFIGCHLVERLLGDGHRVRVLDDFSTGRMANLPFADRHADALEIIRGDIRDLSTVERAAAGSATIYHQAAMRSVPRSVDDPLGANASNVDGTSVQLPARSCSSSKVSPVRRGPSCCSRANFSHLDLKLRN